MPLSDLQASDAAAHASMFVEALGTGASAPKDIVLLNAAAALVVAGRAADLRAGVDVAREAIDTGAPLAKLNALAALSQTLE